MKIQPFATDRRRGVALILVLAFLVILSALVVAFFSSTSTSRREVAEYEAGVTVKQLADIATNVVIGQISDATKSWEIPLSDPLKKNDSPRLAYSTQPGMIHTYDDKGKPVRAFKLYSSDTMVVKGKEWKPTAELATEIPADWPVKSGLYTDLNAPILRPDASGTIKRAGSTTTYTANYPILDPSALSPANRKAGETSAQDGVEGFNIVDVPGYGGAQRNKRPVIGGDDPTGGVDKGKTHNPAPMPVQWIYMLRDGTLTSPKGIVNDGSIADWSNLADGHPFKPSKLNPIVGRVAFWADDDTCKLNPNVHSEGVYWDRAVGRGAAGIPGSPYSEDLLQNNMPVRNEYSRYPGHPATVSLSPLLGFIPEYSVPVKDTLTAADFTKLYQPFYNMAPRVSHGGSNGGTVQTYIKGSTPAPVASDQDRLFVSPDELAFKPDRAGIPFLKKSDLEKAKFFLTPHSRAAETTLFNTPRVSLWQLQQEKDPNQGKNPADPSNAKKPRNTKDDLLAFCGTLGDAKYYFERYSVYMLGPVNDRTKKPADPFGQRTNGPYGSLALPSSQTTYLDWIGPSVERNQKLYTYLQRLTAQNIPGFGGKFTDAAKYGINGRDQILTEMVDLIRFGTNCYAQDATIGNTYNYAPARRMPDAVSGETQIVPLVPPVETPGAGTKGFGRFPTITEAMVIFYGSEQDDNNLGRPRNIRALIALEPYTPSAGSWTWSPLVRYVIRDADKLLVDGASIRFPYKTKGGLLENLVTSRCGYGSGGNHNTAHTGTFAAFRYWNGAGTDATKHVPTLIQPEGNFYDAEKDYLFVSAKIQVDSKKNTLKFDGGTIYVDVHAGYSTEASALTKVQTLQFTFPAISNLPMPRFSSSANDFNARIGSNKFDLVSSEDTVRTMEVDPIGPALGDLRVVAGKKDVGAGYFAGFAGSSGDGYFSSSPIVHSFRNGDGGTVVGGRIHADLLTTGTTPGNPIAARGMKGALMRNNQAGDWDNAPGGFQDGAYINKPDDYYGSGDWWEAPIVTPNKQVSSPVVFGSLPVADSSGALQPWQTLAFSPNPAAGKQHPGFTSPKDHLLLDLFTMPVVEPFAISEPVSSVGKVGLNFQLAPFTYITRATALHGVLKSTRITAIQTGTNPKSGAPLLRLPIDADETTRGFAKRFADLGVFRSASEICDMFLVPRGTTLESVADGNWWQNYKATGDNSREAPYGLIYSRVTTRSNTFTVHMRVQTLRKRAGEENEIWREDVDTVTGEYRGSTTIERYVDLGDKTLPDFATQPDATLDNFYKFRIVNTKKFNP